MNENFEEAIFTHFFELTIFKEYLEIIKILENDANILSRNEVLYDEILSELLNIFPLPQEVICNNIDDLLQFVIDEVNYIWDFQSEKAIDIDNTVKFSPRCKESFQNKF